jgi:hypothetical protein
MASSTRTRSWACMGLDETSPPCSLHSSKADEQLDWTHQISWQSFLIQKSCSFRVEWINDDTASDIWSKLAKFSLQFSPADRDSVIQCHSISSDCTSLALWPDAESWNMMYARTCIKTVRLPTSSAAAAAASKAIGTGKFIVRALRDVHWFSCLISFRSISDASSLLSFLFLSRYVQVTGVWCLQTKRCYTDCLSASPLQCNEDFEEP